jgi:predicted TIM-barrel fold metal-dependent hydrolase
MQDLLESIRLVDHHCHGVTTTVGGIASFEQRLTEAREPMLFGQRYSDGPLGMALLALCPQVLGMTGKTGIDEYWRRREDLGEAEVRSRFLSQAGLDALIVDTGYASEETSPADLGGLAGCPSHEVHRVEAIAEDVLSRKLGAEAFIETLRAELVDAAANGVGFKSIIAYRGGLDLLSGPPAEGEVTGAYARTEATPGPLVDEVLLRHVLYTTLEVASEDRLPIQFHVGYGDDDLDLRSANPLHLERFIREAGEQEVPVVLLHCYPFHREAGFLASVFPNVFFDVGLTIPHVGLEADRVLAEAMEVAPFAKLLYSSDAARLPEFFYLASHLFRRAADSVIGRWMAGGLVDETDAERVIKMIGSENARRVYPRLEPVLTEAA